MPVIFSFGRLYYSARLTWLFASAMSLALPAGFALAFLYWPQLDILLASQPLLSSLLDHWLSATLLSGALWHFVTYSMTPGFLTDGRPELFVLRASSALVAALGAINLVTQLLPRPVLAASTVLYIGFSINCSCWWSAIILELQSDGLVSLLPSSLIHLLMHERPVDWLRRDFFSTVVLRCRQLLPIMMLPEEDLHHGLTQLPPSLREMLEERGGLRKLFLPTFVAQLLEPWQRGPDYLRVRPLSDFTWKVEPPATLLRLNGSAHNHVTAMSPGGTTTIVAAVEEVEAAAEEERQRASTLPAPEWLIIYALRRHAARKLREKVFGGPDASFAQKARNALLAAAVAAAVAYGVSHFGGSRRRATRRRLLA